MHTLPWNCDAVAASFVPATIVSRIDNAMALFTKWSTERYRQLSDKSNSLKRHLQKCMHDLCLFPLQSPTQLLPKHKMLTMFALVLLLSIVVAIGQAAGQPSSTTTSSPPIVFTKNELNEHNLVWKVMNKSCFGKWSGTLQSFRMNKATNTPVCNDNDELLNFRLWAKADTNRMGKKKDTTGTWTVWNLLRKGDEFIVPLRRLPAVSSRPSQLKIGFQPGCVLRIPFNFKQVPRAVIELGYWGNGMRRTVVLEYQMPDKQKRMELKDVTLVMQRAVPWYKNAFFVGNATVAHDIQILPRKAPSNVEDVVKRNRARKPIRIERVELKSMQRVVTTKADMTDDDTRGAVEVLESLLLRLGNNECAARSSSYDVVLPNGLLASFPKEMLAKSSSNAKKTFVLAHEWKRFGQQTFQTLVIDFDVTTGEAIMATMYSYK